MIKEIETNKAYAAGTIKGEFSFSHESHGESFYENIILANRISAVVDEVPIMVSDRLVAVDEKWEGQRVLVSGSFRSFNKRTGDGSHLLLHLFAKEFFVDENFCESENSKIFLSGSICKPTVYRKTPLGREICEIMLAVNREYNRSDYIPCIAWGRNARYAGTLGVGSRINIAGRIQSRNFIKNDVEKTAYEVSINSMEVVMA